MSNFLKKYVINYRDIKSEGEYNVYEEIQELSGWSWPNGTYLSADSKYDVPETVRRLITETDGFDGEEVTLDNVLIQLDW